MRGKKIKWNQRQRDVENEKKDEQKGEQMARTSERLSRRTTYNANAPHMTCITQHAHDPKPKV